LFGPSLLTASPALRPPHVNWWRPLPRCARSVSSCAQSQDPRRPKRLPWSGSCDSASLRAGWRLGASLV